MAGPDSNGKKGLIEEAGPTEVGMAASEELSERTVERLSRLFAAFADPTRLRILYGLVRAGEMCVCDLAVFVGLSVSAVSHQLRLLRDRDLVRARRDGRMVYYRVADDRVSRLIAAGVEHSARG